MQKQIQVVKVKQKLQMGKNVFHFYYIYLTGSGSAYYSDFECICNRLKNEIIQKMIIWILDEYKTSG